jgi:hypothetical protein
MKNLILKSALLFVLVTISSFTFSQSVTNAYMVQTGSWSSYSSDWIWGDWKSVDIDFMFRGNVVLVNDAANSSYTTIGDPIEVDNNFSWNAIDEKGRKCMFTMAFGTNPQMIIVMYGDTCYRYAIE